METTKQLYERAKKAADCPTDYQFAKRFNVSQQVVSRWKNGQVSFDDDHAALIASIIKTEAGYVMACASAERAKSEKSRSNWARVAALLAAAGLSTSAGAFDNNRISAQLSEVHFTNYANKLRRYLTPRRPLMA